MRRALREAIRGDVRTRYRTRGGPAAAQVSTLHRARGVALDRWCGAIFNRFALAEYAGSGTVCVFEFIYTCAAFDGEYF